jgi:large subunit ribosomal protein L31
MKPGILPDCHPVVFQDATTGVMFLTRSTLTSSRTIEWQTPHGCTPTHLSSLKSPGDSHPFWTGAATTHSRTGRRCSTARIRLTAKAAT